MIGPEEQIKKPNIDLLLDHVLEVLPWRTLDLSRCVVCVELPWDLVTQKDLTWSDRYFHLIEVRLGDKESLSSFSSEIIPTLACGHTPIIVTMHTPTGEGFVQVLAETRWATPANNATN